MRQKTIGEILSEERTRHQMSLLEFSKRTRIRTQYLQALEKNKFAKLPAATFVKGYIKTYAKMFGFDPVPVLAILRRDYKESAKGKLVPREFIAPVITHRQPMRTVTVVAVLLSVAFISLFGYVMVQWYNLNQPPLVVVNEPAENSFVGPQVMVEGQTEPEAVVTVNTQPISLKPDGTFQTELEFATEGIVTIVVKATDRVGRSSTTVRHVQVQF